MHQSAEKLQLRQQLEDQLDQALVELREVQSWRVSSSALGLPCFPSLG